MKKLRFITCLLVVAFLLAACAAPATTVSTSLPPTAVAPANTPVSTQAPGNPLTVLAAASLTESFSDLGKQFEAGQAGTTVNFSFAGSQQLAQQLAQGAPADVFASASGKYMDAAITAGRVITGTASTFALNRLVVIVPSANPAGVKTLQDLSHPGLKLVLAAKEVPVGQYAVQFLEQASASPDFTPAFKDDVLQNVVSYEDNVKAVLTKVVLGEADAGIVYTTDAASAQAGKLTNIDIPDKLNVIAKYPIAAISDSKQPDLAKAFVTLVLSPDGQAVLQKYGFIAKP